MISSKRLAIALILINMIAFIYGLYYYRNQLARVDQDLWIFAVDSPLNAVLFGLVIALALLGYRNNLLTSLAAIGNIKYGIWTMFVILFHNPVFLAPEYAGQYVFLFIAHIGQLLQGLYLADVSGLGEKKGWMILSILTIWILLNDYMDYVVGTRPIIPEEGIGIVAAATVMISLVSIYIVYTLSRDKKDLFKGIGSLRRLKNLLRKGQE